MQRAADPGHSPPPVDGTKRLTDRLSSRAPDCERRCRVERQGVHLLSVKVGCQRPNGQKKTEMTY
jgi:hypothetical protein